jgi:hypothetical protein
LGRNYFSLTLKPARGTRALSRRSCDVENFTRAAPGKGETGATVTVIVNDGATVVDAIAFEAQA